MAIQKQVPKSEEKKGNMPAVWFSLKRSLQCKTDISEVQEPKPKLKPKSRKTTTSHMSSILTSKKLGRSGCSRSIANLKDVIHGSKRQFEKPRSCSPRSIGSNDFLNPISHEVILSTNSRCELKISDVSRSTFVGTLRPGTPGPALNLFNNPPLKNSPKKWHHRDSESPLFGGSSYSVDKIKDFRNGFSSSTSVVNICHKCGEHFGRWEAVEAHHLSKHAVTELIEGDSSRKIVEIICRTSFVKSEKQWGRIERVLKVHNMQRTLSRFEDYREMVKTKASKLHKKHPRCLADGNELLRFHGTTIACRLGANGSSSLCASESCSVCGIIRNGFLPSNKEKLGIFTTSTSGRAFEAIEVSTSSSNEQIQKKTALIVCRVIAGRVHRAVENVEEIPSSHEGGFDSVAGKVGLYSNIEELFLLNPQALLPCFVVICK